MRFTHACLFALVLVGTGASVRAQRKVIETPAGTRINGNTNTVTPVAPIAVPGGNLFDQIYRPGAIQFAPPDIGPSVGPSSVGPVIDPLLRKRLLDEQFRRKNWAIENAARLNRGGEATLEIRRSEADGRKAVGAGREPTAAELGLMAVDPKFAREFQKNSGAPAESALDLARQRALRQQQGQDPNNPNRPRNPGEPPDPTDPTTELTGGLANDAKDPTKADAKADRGTSPLDSLGSSRLEGAVDRLAARQSGDLLNRDTAAGADSVNPGLELLRKERDAELLEILGTSSGGTGTAGGGVAAGGDLFIAPTRASRLADFEKFLSPEPPAATAFKSGSDSVFGAAATPLGNSASASAVGLKRDVPELGAPNVNLNLVPAAPTPTAPAIRLQPQPAQLPFPVRGKGGF